MFFCEYLQGTNRKKSPIGTNNQHLKRIIINQQSIGEEQSRCQSVGTGSKMIIRSGHEAVTGNFKTVDMRGNPGAKNFNTSISDAEKKTKLPDLSLHSVETDDAGKKTKCYNNDDDDDDDSKDVLIGSLPNVDIIHEQNSNSISQHIMEITGTLPNDVYSINLILDFMYFLCTCVCTLLFFLWLQRKIEIVMILPLKMSKFKIFCMLFWFLSILILPTLAK